MYIWGAVAIIAVLWLLLLHCYYFYIDCIHMENVIWNSRCTSNWIFPCQNWHLLLNMRWKKKKQYSWNIYCYYYDCDIRFLCDKWESTHVMWLEIIIIIMHYVWENERNQPCCIFFPQCWTITQFGVHWNNIRTFPHSNCNHHFGWLLLFAFETPHRYDDIQNNDIRLCVVDRCVLCYHSIQLELYSKWEFRRGAWECVVFLLSYVMCVYISLVTWCMCRWHEVSRDNRLQHHCHSHCRPYPSSHLRITHRTGRG